MPVREFQHRGHQVRIEVFYPHTDTPSQAQYLFLIDGTRCGAAYLEDHAEQMARTFINRFLDPQQPASDTQKQSWGYAWDHPDPSETR
jgi:hypothetical protein